MYETHFPTLLDNNQEKINLKMHVIYFSVECPIRDFVCNSPWQSKSDANNWEECGMKCKEDDNCKYWSYLPTDQYNEKGCYLHCCGCPKYRLPGTFMSDKACFEGDGNI